MLNALHHFCNVKRLVTLSKKSDSHVKHCVIQFSASILTPDSQHEGISCNVQLFDKATLSVPTTKTFAIKNCVWCAKDRAAVLKMSRSNPQLLIKSVVPADTISDLTCVQGMHITHIMMSQSMMKKRAQHTKLPQILTGRVKCLPS